MNRKTLLARNAEATRYAAWYEHQAAAWDGTGGYAPWYAQETGVYASGSALRTLPEGFSGSYLQKHEDEDNESYAQRLYNTKYTNYLRTGIDAFLGFIAAKPPQRSWDSGELPQSLRSWAEDVDGRGTTLNDWLVQAGQWALLFTVAPYLITRKQGEPPRLAFVYPQSIFDWDTNDQGDFTRLKIVYVREILGADWNRVQVYEAQVWDGGQYQILQTPVEGNDDTPVTVVQDWTTTGFNAPPLVVLRYKDPLLPGGLRGWSPGDELGQINHAAFQNASRTFELHERQGAPTLAWPVAPGAEKDVAAIPSGSSHAFPVSEGSKPEYISPPDSCILSHEREREALRGQAYRSIGLETIMTSGSVPTSGVARQYEFAHTEAALQTFANRLEKLDRDVVGYWLRYGSLDGGSLESALASYDVSYPASFDVQDVTALLDHVERAFALPIDPITKLALVRQVRKALANLSVQEEADSDRYLTAVMAREEALDGEEANTEPGDPAQERGEAEPPDASGPSA